ncbi:hypothetical protein [Paraburkholderia sp.]|uniref:hypothetical protein n=1 Tax=Paraburkholderia sp. TaxID=1926495 RepID=UPI003C7DE144
MSFAHFSLLALLGVDTTSFGTPLFVEQPALLFLVPPLCLSYPILWLLARHRPPFHWPAPIGIALVSAIPYLGSELVALRTFTSLGNYIVLQETSRVEYARDIICVGDPDKVGANSFENAKRVLADPKLVWGKPGLKEPLSSSEWTQQPDPCAYDARVVPDKALTSLANAQAAGKKLFIAMTAAASIAFMLLLAFAANGITHARLLAEFPDVFRRPVPPRDEFKS